MAIQGSLEGSVEDWAEDLGGDSAEDLAAGSAADLAAEEAGVGGGSGDRCHRVPGRRQAKPSGRRKACGHRHRRQGDPTEIAGESARAQQLVPR